MNFTKLKTRTIVVVASAASIVGLVSVASTASARVIQVPIVKKTCSQVYKSQGYYGTSGYRTVCTTTTAYKSVFVPDPKPAPGYNASKAYYPNGRAFVTYPAPKR